MRQAIEKAKAVYVEALTPGKTYRVQGHQLDDLPQGLQLLFSQVLPLWGYRLMSSPDQK
jgi:hypothetical protein